MTFHFYKETQLEQLVTELYLTNGPGIHSPEHLQSFDLLSKSFDIEVVIYRGRPFTDKVARVVFLNEQHGHFLNRMNFFHEAGHIVRHEGDQRRMPKLFKDAQEAEAEAFALYAAIPFYILRQLDLPNHRREAIDYIARVFKVPLKFAGKRVDQIQRRILQAQFDAAAVEFTSTCRDLEISPPSIPKTEIYAFYDYTADLPGPTQYVIEVDSFTMESTEELLFDPNDRFKRLEPEDIHNYSGIQVFWRDLIYKNGRIGFDLSAMALKYELGPNRFIVNAKDIELLIQYEVGF